MAFNGINWKDQSNKDKFISFLSSGMTYEATGKEFGISRQRVKQVVQELNLDVSTIGRKIISKEKKKQKEKSFKEKWGDKLNTDLYKMQRRKYSLKKHNSKGWEWDILFSEIKWVSHCPILGIELDYFLEYRAENSPSFDRIDPSKGYVTGNVQIVSWRANRIKNDGSPEEHRKIAEYLDKLEKQDNITLV